MWGKLTCSDARCRQRHYSSRLCNFWPQFRGNKADKIPPGVGTPLRDVFPISQGRRRLHEFAFQQHDENPEGNIQETIQGGRPNVSDLRHEPYDRNRHSSERQSVREARNETQYRRNKLGDREHDQVVP